jgi:hypothetical protein
MGHTTKISDYELQRGDPVHTFEDDKPKEKAKVVTAKQNKPPVSTTQVVKDK